MPAYTLHLGDCLEVMPGIPDDSVDAIIADWPYGTTACKWDSIIPLEPLWGECKRVIKPGGAIVLTASQPFTSALVMSNLEWFKYELIWEKPKATGFLWASRRPMAAHENIIVFCSGNHTYNAQKTEGKPYSRGYTRDRNLEQLKQGKRVKSVLVQSEDGKRWPRSVIKITTAEFEGKLHPTQKPVALMEYLIKTYTNPGDLVLDNTFGSCSTGEACLRTGRRFIGIEKDPGYFEIAQNRLERVEQELREAQIARERQPYLMEAMS